MSDQRPMPRGDAMENLVIAQMRDDLRADRTRRRRRLGVPGWSIITSATAAVVAVVAITVSMLAAPTPSYAATPPMLQITAAQTGTGDAAELLADLAEQLRASDAPDPAPPGQPQQIDLQTWGLVTTVGAEGEDVPPPYIAPENLTLTRYPDGVWSQVAVAGTPYDTQGKPVDDPKATPPGTELYRFDEEAGQHTYLFPDPVPEDAGELRQLMLDAGLSEDSTVSDWLSQVEALLMERVLRPAEEAALLEVIAGLDLELAGTTTDRLGREAYVFESPPGDSDFVERILVSLSGHVLATETVWVGHDRTDIPSPSVMSYYAFERRDQ
ncbi:hypothetical protein IF188_08670 [Microbacterium sp. NEAU-LLC]|uniref:CU044_5270 family protein n=1 Tax=Microbacterium helvum TaxID=2773713 RepID=A0ABR8NM70_9MICO|nr:hypothetical protein [Microbacterium helvum]MBD3941763.1 hypothetical protein [Microbacterium helvum]